jgi:hypothetical protein
MKGIPMWYEPSVPYLVPAMPNLELRESISVLFRMCHISVKPEMVGRDGTCIDAASPSHAMTMGPMKAIPMWYEFSVSHLGPNMPNLELRVSIRTVLLNLFNKSKTRDGWQGWHMY